MIDSLRASRGIVGDVAGAGRRQVESGGDWQCADTRKQGVTPLLTIDKFLNGHFAAAYLG